MRTLVPALGAGLLLTMGAAGGAGAGIPRDDPPAKASVTPSRPRPRDTILLKFRARYDSYRATYIVQTVGPRPACQSGVKATRSYAGGVAPGDRLKIAVRAPSRGWCGGIHRVRVLVVADVDTADGTCEPPPESGSSDCPQELHRAFRVDRRTSFSVG